MITANKEESKNEPFCLEQGRVKVTVNFNYQYITSSRCIRIKKFKIIYIFFQFTINYKE